ncbi:MAG: bifunctional diaminohydroxyphosphoribosylaminopyrimidine deaminase/5-amino-6-(5-phosphoribosylamino)uracil reductase RibD [Fibrobacterota bacterium]
MAYTEQDIHFMQQALDLAWKAKGKTFPNPAVGAVVVTPGGSVVGKGATDVCGGPHAEKVALKRAGAKARGATMYVTLEPCSHFGRTSPCTGSIIKAGIKKVIMAVKDPNPLVKGRGVRQLKAEGIEVQTGLMRKEATDINEDFFWAITRKSSWVTLKLALTLDGRIADIHDNSKWITSAQSRRFVQELRRCHAAIGVGKNTLHKDDPRLTARTSKICYPARIVFSPDAVIPPESYFFQHAHEARSIVVLRGGAEKSITRKGNMEFWHTGAVGKAESLKSFLRMAHDEGLTSVFIEGGQRLASDFLEYDLVNKMYLFYGNKIVGRGREGLLFSEGMRIENCLSLEKISHTSLGKDVLISGYPIVEAGKEESGAKTALRR